MGTKTADNFKCPKCGSGIRENQARVDRNRRWNSPSEYGGHFEALNVGFDEHLQVGFGIESSPTSVERWRVASRLPAGFFNVLWQPVYRLTRTKHRMGALVDNIPIVGS
jgi:hypothetical protein